MEILKIQIHVSKTGQGLDWSEKDFPAPFGAIPGHFLHGPTKIAARDLATYLIPGCVGRGVRLGSEGSSVGGGVGVGGSGVWKFGVRKVEKIKILKIQIRSAQNVDKVWISRKKILPALFGAI